MANQRSVFIRLLRFLAGLLTFWLISTCLLVLSLRWVDPPTSAFMLSDRIAARVGDGPRVRHAWRDWQQISGAMKVAVIAAEDQRFPEHKGFDFKSIDKALEERERGKRIRGASTITQQVAKNLFLWSGRSWLRKGLEAYFTVLVELFWSKQRILEVYLNVIELGPGIYGVGSASEIYFRKSASRLNSHEAALLAAVLPNPTRLRANAPSRYVRSRQDWIVRQMRGLGGTSLLKRLD